MDRTKSECFEEKYETTVTESGDPINPAEFYDDEMDEVDWISFYEECEY